ncbi:MAG: PEP-utilizing enzyme, partial [Eubacteriales bacterium]|nr:PEP-utilizing enzyme [Eubacteriales bacterium]
SEKEAVMMIDPKQLDALLHPQFDPDVLKKSAVVGKGIAASPGAAAGRVVFSTEAAQTQSRRGHKVVLIRQETSAEDIEGMNIAEGVLTARGGMTSHAAVVARGMGTCCVAGCNELQVDEVNKVCSIAGKIYHEKDHISLDGSTGLIYDGKLPTVEASIGGDFGRLMGWADQYRKLRVRTNADNPHDTAIAVRFGAEGIGLCRTEHMFFQEDRIPAMREMIVAKSVQARRDALNKLLPMQRSDFEGIYMEMGENPVTIRFLDPPLHEFLPTKLEEIADLARRMHMPVEEVQQTIESLHEFNPMMGHRGCRLAITYPEIAEMQTRAVIEAAINVSRQTGRTVTPEIMIPLVGEEKELHYVKTIVDRTARVVMDENDMEIPYLVGTMIEIPRAALTADALAEEAQFFSFGTNDLSQMTFGFSRDDAGKFLDSNYNKKIYEFDPFAKLDIQGVGRLVEMAVKLGRETRPDIKLGICGEQGGDPSTVEFCNKIGLNYVSCSPFRVPIARLAAAQAAIRADAENK